MATDRRRNLVRARGVRDELGRGVAGVPRVRCGAYTCNAALIKAHDFFTISCSLDIALRMAEHLRKLRLLMTFAHRTFGQLLGDLWAYYSSPYPFLLFLGTFRRIVSRAKAL